MKPNIIFVLLDGSRHDRMKISPEFSELLNEGTLLNNVSTAIPYTFGSINVILTGQYGKENGVDGYYQVGSLKTSIPTLSEILQENGYFTSRGLINDKILSSRGFDIREEFNEYEITQKDPEVVIMGDIYKNFKWEILDRIFKLVYLENSALIALHQNKYCMRDGKISLDLGPFVKAIEYSSGKKSILMGKPEKNFFYLAIKDINIEKDNVLMIGDDIVSDIKGAKDFGVRAIQVKTGKYQNSDCDNKIVQPDERIDSIVDIAKILKGN